MDIVSGLHWYLKHWCGSHISWDKTGGSQLFSVPNVGLLPRVHDAGISVRRPVPWSYYQNAVTSSCKLLLFCFHIIFLWCCVWNWHLKISFHFHVILLFGFGRFFCLVGLEKMGKGNRLDGFAGCQFATCIYGTGGYLAESVQGHFHTSLSLHNSWYGFRIVVFVTHGNFLIMVFEPTNYASLN